MLPRDQVEGRIVLKVGGAQDTATPTYQTDDRNMFFPFLGILSKVSYNPEPPKVFVKGQCHETYVQSTCT